MKSVGLKPYYTILETEDNSKKGCWWPNEVENQYITKFQSFGMANHNRSHKGRTASYCLWYVRPLSLDIQDIKSIQLIRQLGATRIA